MKKDVIIALDFKDFQTTMEFLDLFKDKKPFVKVGMELFYSEGPEIIKELKKRGHKIFLDLKLHDIPNTVSKSMEVLAKLGVDVCNLHAAGTIKMMEAAKIGLEKGSVDGKRPLLIAVTQLTSTSDEALKEELLIDTPMAETVKTYALNAKKAGLDGVVCSPLETEIIHNTCGKEFLTVTPGIRFESNSKDDQTRIATPAKARIWGSDFIVVGRPITKAEDPVAAYEYCLKEFAHE